MRVLITPYNEKWTQQFEEQRLLISKSLINLNPVIEHIGSTSIPDMVAKPIIDILVGVGERDLESTVETMIQAGYSYVSKFEEAMPYRKFFIAADILPQVIGPDDTRKFGVDIKPRVNIHVIPPDSVHFKRHIAFRDYLKAHENIKQQYILLKLQIAEKDLIDHNEYNDLKNNFIKYVENEALSWYRKK